MLPLKVTLLNESVALTNWAKVPIFAFVPSHITIGFGYPLSSSLLTFVSERELALCETAVYKRKFHRSDRYIRKNHLMSFHHIQPRNGYSCTLVCHLRFGTVFCYAETERLFRASDRTRTCDHEFCKLSNPFYRNPCGRKANRSFTRSTIWATPAEIQVKSETAYAHSGNLCKKTERSIGFYRHWKFY